MTSRVSTKRPVPVSSKVEYLSLNANLNPIYYKGLFYKDFTGIDSEYEEPFEPEVTLETAKHNIDDCVKIIVKYLETKGIIKPHKPEDEDEEEDEDYEARELFAKPDELAELKEKAAGYLRLNINKV